jgi:hypothetical protein
MMMYENDDTSNDVIDDFHELFLMNYSKTLFCYRASKISQCGESLFGKKNHCKQAFCFFSPPNVFRILGEKFQICIQFF